MLQRLCCIVVIALSVVACERKTPPTPAPGANPGETITGRERIGWDQPAGSASELSTYRYAIYADGARSEVADVSCGTTAAAAGFACSGRLPALSNGEHTLELAAFVLDGDIFESTRSAPLRVTVQASTAPAPAAVRWTSGPAGVTTDGLQLRVERLADGLIDPVDAAVAPDGRLFVAERGGCLRVLDVLTRAPMATMPVDVEGGAILSLALDTDFERSRFVYVVYATVGERPVYRLARFREAGRSLAERAVIIDVLAPAGDAPAAVLRATRDGRLLLALGNSGVARPSSFDGKLLRFERDGTTPAGQNGAPVVAEGLQSPVGLAWNRARSRGWVVDRIGGAGRLVPVVVDPADRPRVGGASRIDGGAGSAIVYEGGLLPALMSDVLVASEAERGILRLSHVDEAGTRLVATEWLLRDRVGGIRLIAVAPDGAIYICTAESVGRIVADPR
jgi:glucose/arabinose dehydrogenase